MERGIHKGDIVYGGRGSDKDGEWRRDMKMVGGEMVMKM